MTYVSQYSCSGYIYTQQTMATEGSDSESSRMTARLTNENQVVPNPGLPPQEISVMLTPPETGQNPSRTPLVSQHGDIRSTWLSRSHVDLTSLLSEDSTPTRSSAPENSQEFGVVPHHEHDYDSHDDGNNTNYNVIPEDDEMSLYENINNTDN